MNRRRLAPLALAAALSLTACTGAASESGAPTSDSGAPLSPDSALPDVGDFASDRPDFNGGSATVTFDGVTYEFSSDRRSSCTVLGGVLLDISLDLESIDGQSADPSNGKLDIELPTPTASETLPVDALVQLRITDQGFQFYQAGGSDSDQEVTLTVGEYTAHGEQVLEHTGDRPPITAQIDVTCHVGE